VVVSKYRCVASSVEGFVQQLAVCYVTHGYYFYVTGQIPEKKDPVRVDQRIIERYRINVSKSARVRQKKAGEANLQYLRFGRSFVILATPGVHHFFQEEAAILKDLRETPIRFYDYAISCHKSWGKGALHASVRIDRRRYSELKAHFVKISVHRSVKDMILEFWRFPFEPYAPIRNQLYMILRAVNRKRHAAGLEPVPKAALRLFRKTIQPFAEDPPELSEDRETFRASGG